MLANIRRSETAVLWACGISEVWKNVSGVGNDLATKAKPSILAECNDTK